MRARRELYPAIEPWDTGYIDVDPPHRIYYEQCGLPHGQPAVFLHGGPGGGLSPAMRRFFDPTHWRVVLFDQRGCGRSTPTASIDNNTTWHLVADIERLREHLGITRWMVFGGSWGSTLALAYAQRHPQRVSALVLRGIFLLRRWEIEWFYQRGASLLFPEAWQDYLAPIPESERGDLVAAYYRRLTAEDPPVRLAAARAWSVWEARTSYLLEREDYVASFDVDERALAFARIECHYFYHRGFFECDGQLLRDAGRLNGIPGTIVQGRYDVVCPAQSAWELHRAWPGSTYVVVPDAGHSAFEPGNASALVEATDRYRGLT